MRVRLTIAPLLAALCAPATFAQAPDLNAIPPYKKELNVVGGLRIAGSELKGVVDSGNTSPTPRSLPTS